MLLVWLRSLILGENLFLVPNCTFCAIVTQTIFSCEFRIMLSRSCLEYVVCRQITEIIHILRVLWRVFSVYSWCLLLGHKLRLCINVLILILTLRFFCRCLLIFLSLLVLINQLLQRCLYCGSNFFFQAIQGYEIFH